MTKPCTICSDSEKKKYLDVIANMSVPALKLLVELSQKPNAEKKLLEKAALIKMFL